MAFEQYCFCELAPFYALGHLSESEQQWIEQQVIDCPELAEELSQYQEALTAIPYSSPLEPLPGSLKNRLFDRLELSPPVAAASTSTVTRPSFAQTTPSGFQAVKASELEWQPHPFVPLVSIAPIHTDPIKREIVGLLRAEPGMTFPIHRHAAIEEIYMLTGHLTIEETVYSAGDYIRSEPGSCHAPFSTDGCTFFFRTSLDDEYPEELVTTERSTV